MQREDKQMDRHMTVMNGEDATKAIRENEGEEKHVPIIALTII